MAAHCDPQGHILMHLSPLLLLSDITGLCKVLGRKRAERDREREREKRERKLLKVFLISRARLRYVGTASKAYMEARVASIDQFVINCFTLDIYLLPSTQIERKKQYFSQ
jgi:hypothetical protein